MPRSRLRYLVLRFDAWFIASTTRKTNTSRGRRATRAAGTVGEPHAATGTPTMRQASGPDAGSWCSGRLLHRSKVFASRTLSVAAIRPVRHLELDHRVDVLLIRPSTSHRPARVLSWMKRAAPCACGQFSSSASILVQDDEPSYLRMASWSLARSALTFRPTPGSTRSLRLAPGPCIDRQVRRSASCDGFHVDVDEARPCRAVAERHGFLIVGEFSLFSMYLGAKSVPSASLPNPWPIDDLQCPRHRSTRVTV